MRTTELERLSDLLLKWSSQHPHEHELKDYVGELRQHIELELENREAVDGD